MKIQLIRNATMKRTYSGRTILTDPMFSPKDEFDPFAGVARNPRVELPHTIERTLDGVGGVLVSHDHPDHFDSAASVALPKTIPGFEPIIMDIDQTLATAKASPDAIVVAIHMEALDHCPVSREQLRQRADKEAIPPSRLMIPKGGDTIAF